MTIIKENDREMRQITCNDGREIRDQFLLTTDEKPQIKKRQRGYYRTGNKNVYDKVVVITPKVFDIAASIQKNNKVSDKQYKHIKAAISIINLIGDQLTYIIRRCRLK